MGFSGISAAGGDCSRGPLASGRGGLGFAVLASLLGIAKALRVEPNEVLA
jgi:hypothetical protein